MRAALVLALAGALAGAASAQSPLDAVADALGGRDRVDALGTVVVAQRVEAPFGDRGRAVRSTMTVRFPNAFRWDVRVRGRSRSVVLAPGGAVAVVEGEARPLGLEAELRVAAEAWLHPLVLAARRREVVATAVSPGLVRVEIDDLEDDVLVGLDADGRPDLLTTQRRSGDRVEYVSVRFSDYREVGGVWVPHRVAQSVAGTTTGTAAVERVEVDAEVATSVFTVSLDADG